MRDRKDKFEGVPVTRDRESDVPRNKDEREIEEKALRIIELVRAGETTRAEKLAQEIFQKYE